MRRGDKNRITFTKRSVFSIMSFLLFFMALLITGELVCRLKIYFKTKDTFYLLTPFQKRPTEKVNYRLEINEFFSGGTYYFKMKTGKFHHPAPYNYGYYTINSLGFRGREFLPLNKNNKIRIFCIGESSTFCMESADEQTWPARLGYYLDKIKINRFEVINSGFPAAASMTYKNLIRFELIKYQPDVLIIYAGANEMILERNIIKRRANKFLASLHSKLYYKCMLYTLLVEKISCLIHKSPAPASIYTSNSEEVFNSNIEEIIKLCREHSLKIIFVRQLYYSHRDLFLHDGLSLEEINGILAKPKDGSWITPDKIYTFNRMMRNLTSLCRKYNITIMDFRREFYNRLINDEQLFYDYIHLTPRGNDLLARLISEHLLDAIKD